MKESFQNEIKTMMDEVLNIASARDALSMGTLEAQNLFYGAIIPSEIIKAAHFEQYLGSVFTNGLERLAQIVAERHLGYAATRHRITGTIREGRLRRIQQSLNSSAFSEAVPQSWNECLAFISKGKGQPIPVTVVCDLYAEDRANHKKYAFELKAPLPNSDQTKVSKEKILKLYSMEPLQVDGTFFALPYNPYGRREDYAWSFPARWFNMKEDEVVLIGEEFWEKVGGPGTYQSFINAVNSIGKGYKERIYREFLGIEPPSEPDEGKL